MPRTTTPLLRRVPPVKELLALSARVPAPFMVRLVAVILPPRSVTVVLLEFTTLMFPAKIPAPSTAMAPLVVAVSPKVTLSPEANRVLESTPTPPELVCQLATLVLQELLAGLVLQIRFQGSPVTLR